MATWPGSLPDEFLVSGFLETLPNNVLRSKMDVGPAKLRRISTAADRPITGQIYMSAAQVATHDTFYVTTLKSGSLPFDWTDPRTDASVSFRYFGLPTYERSGVDWIVSIKLELLP